MVVFLYKLHIQASFSFTEIDLGKTCFLFLQNRNFLEEKVGDRKWSGEGSMKDNFMQR